MKKNIFMLAALFSVGLAMTSCSSSDDNDGTNPVDKGFLEYPYSTLSVADQKLKLSAEGESTIKKMEGLASEESVKLLESFANIQDGLFDLLDANITTLSTEETIVKLSKYYGEYVWNVETETWSKSDKLDVTDKFIAIFPANDQDENNTAKIEATAVASNVTINENEIPSNVVANLYVSDKKTGEITAEATGISESTFVETGKVNANLGAYTLTSTVDKKGNNNTVKLNFSKGTDAIINGSVDLAATITQAMLDSGDLSSAGDGNVLIKINDNVAIVGYVDGKALIPEMDAMDLEYDNIHNKYPWGEGKDGDIAKEELALSKKKIEIINKYSNLALVSTTEKYKIAKVTLDLDIKEVQATSSKKDGKDKYGNDNYVTYTYTDYDTNNQLIFTFNDDTKVEASVFFGTGFDKVITAWDKFIALFN